MKAITFFVYFGIVFALGVGAHPPIKSSLTTGDNLATVDHISQTGKKVRVTAYCPCEQCCGKYADGITASGHVIQKGDRFVAAPKDIPFGTMIDIPGYGRVPVLDRGGAIKGDRLDVYFDTHEEALEWGVQYLEIVK